MTARSSASPLGFEPVTSTRLTLRRQLAQRLSSLHRSVHHHKVAHQIVWHPLPQSPLAISLWQTEFTARYRRDFRAKDSCFSEAGISGNPEQHPCRTLLGQEPIVRSSLRAIWLLVPDPFFKASRQKSRSFFGTM